MKEQSKNKITKISSGYTEEQRKGEFLKKENDEFLY